MIISGGGVVMGGGVDAVVQLAEAIKVLKTNYRVSQKRTHVQNATERPRDKNGRTDPRAHSEILSAKLLIPT